MLTGGFQAGIGKLSSQYVCVITIVNSYPRHLLQTWSHLAHVFLARKDSRRSHSMVWNLSDICEHALD